MDGVLNRLMAIYAYRVNILNALSVGIDALNRGTDLDHPCKHLALALIEPPHVAVIQPQAPAEFEQAQPVCDVDRRVALFDVLNRLCGDRLPTPTFVADWRSIYGNCGPCAYADGSDLPYDAKVLLAADLNNANSRLQSYIMQQEGEICAAADRCGKNAFPFINVVGMLYLNLHVPMTDVLILKPHHHE